MLIIISIMLKGEICLKRYYIITKQTILITMAIILAVIFAFVVFTTTDTQPTSNTNKKLPVYCVGRDDNKISISFDAAWGAEDTQTLIDILAKYNVKATFFVVGEWVDKYPNEVKALSDAGHEIQNHSNTHPYMTSLSRDKMMAEINSCNEKIEKITGKKPTLIRVPYGDYNNTVIETVKSMNMHTIQWDVDSLDWKNLSAADITKRVTEKTKSGSILLFHNAAKNTPEALPTILETLQGKGYEFVPISQLIYKDNYEIKVDGTQSKIS